MKSVEMAVLQDKGSGDHKNAQGPHGLKARSGDQGGALLSTNLSVRNSLQAVLLYLKCSSQRIIHRVCKSHSAIRVLAVPAPLLQRMSRMWCSQTTVGCLGLEALGPAEGGCPSALDHIT